MKKQRIVCMLQNMWGSGGYVPALFFKLYSKNPTAQRCYKSFAEYDVYFTETTPVVGLTPDSCPPIDEEFVELIVNNLSNFDAIVAVGSQAKKALSKYNLKIPIVYMRHPNARGWSYAKDGFVAANELKHKLENNIL